MSLSNSNIGIISLVESTDEDDDHDDEPQQLQRLDVTAAATAAKTSSSNDTCVGISSPVYYNQPLPDDDDDDSEDDDVVLVQSPTFASGCATSSNKTVLNDVAYATAATTSKGRRRYTKHEDGTTNCSASTSANEDDDDDEMFLLLNKNKRLGKNGNKHNKRVNNTTTTTKRGVEQDTKIYDITTPPTNTCITTTNKAEENKNNNKKRKNDLSKLKDGDDAEHGDDLETNKTLNAKLRKKANPTSITTTATNHIAAAAAAAAAKTKAKEIKQLQRLQQQQNKLFQKEIDLKNKKYQALYEQQYKGKFALQEISLVMHSYCRDSGGDHQQAQHVSSSIASTANVNTSISNTNIIRNLIHLQMSDTYPILSYSHYNNNNHDDMKFTTLLLPRNDKEEGGQQQQHDLNGSKTNDRVLLEGSNCKECIIFWTRRDYIKGGAPTTISTPNTTTTTTTSKNTLLPGKNSTIMGVNTKPFKSATAATTTNALVASPNKNNNNTSIPVIDNNNSNNDNANLEWMDIMIIIFDNPSDFLNLLIRDKTHVLNDEYPLLRKWLKDIRTFQLRAYQGRRIFVRRRNGEKDNNNDGKISLDEDYNDVGEDYSKTAAREEGMDNEHGGQQHRKRSVLILHGVEDELHKRWNTEKGQGKKHRRTSFEPTNDEELHDAIIWLLMEERIECELSSSVGDTMEYLSMLTRALAELPYTEEVTELHCIRKLKGNKEDAVQPLDRARDCWKRQLQQVPGMSDTRAMSLIQHYPTAKSLLEKYFDPNLSVDTKRTLLVTCFDRDRAFSTLSDAVYRLMTSDNPLELL